MKAKVEKSVHENLATNFKRVDDVDGITTHFTDEGGNVTELLTEEFDEYIEGRYPIKEQRELVLASI